ncbi:hypothetical protein [Bradyrhizobium sp. SZCCHNRI3043]|uniref:hypothetical protein n=1 Tax=Bradyrhizobium sp. SZCCHNRI3043 TaxID=3057292 RepID=UPI0028E58026|nr:hypothetical protein [Bradyrhizobium sp. SZCCHNRI3043]
MHHHDVRSNFRRGALTEQLDHQALTAQGRNQLIAKSDEHGHEGRMASQTHRMIIRRDGALVSDPVRHRITAHSIN